MSFERNALKQLAFVPVRSPRPEEALGGECITTVDDDAKLDGELLCCGEERYEKDKLLSRAG